MSRRFLRQDHMNEGRNGNLRGPGFMKLGRSIRYHKEDLDTWLIKSVVIAN